MSTYGFSINVGRTAAGQTFIHKMANWMWLPMLAMGAMVHAGMGAVFGLVHAAAFSVLGIDSGQAAWGLLFGLVHWAVVGMALGMLPLMHPRLRRAGNGPAANAGDLDQGDLLDAPGCYALNYPMMTALGFLMLHLLFGLIFGALYGNWAG